jgi:hypothetical protein
MELIQAKNEILIALSASDFDTFYSLSFDNLKVYCQNVGRHRLVS